MYSAGSPERTAMATGWSRVAIRWAFTASSPPLIGGEEGALVTGGDAVLAGLDPHEHPASSNTTIGAAASRITKPAYGGAAAREAARARARRVEPVPR